MEPYDVTTGIILSRVGLDNLSRKYGLNNRIFKTLFRNQIYLKWCYSRGGDDLRNVLNKESRFQIFEGYFFC